MERDPKSVVAMVFYEGGSHGFEEPFDPRKSVEDWIEHFKSETKKNTNAKYPIVFLYPEDF